LLSTDTENYIAIYCKSQSLSGWNQRVFASFAS